LIRTSFGSQFTCTRPLIPRRRSTCICRR
jgi:hypothetical protein